jgi:uncharacterized protein YdhG (YjbR/CyaY superfamily)
MLSANPDSIDAYISTFPSDIQTILEQVRAVIQKTAPDAEEKISYGMPTYTLNNVNLVHFAAFKSHIGFYPTPVGMDTFKNDLAGYKTGKGSVQFPLDQPMPFDLIKRIVEFRIEDVLKKAPKKKPSKK